MSKYTYNLYAFYDGPGGRGSTARIGGTDLKGITQTYEGLIKKNPNRITMLIRKPGNKLIRFHHPEGSYDI